MQIGKKKFVIIIVVAFLAGALVSGGVFTIATNPSDQETYAKYEKLDELYSNIKANYYKEVDEDALMEGACKGLVAGLDDPYSSYMTAKEYESFLASATGEYSGVGITFAEDINGNYVVIEVIEDSPAEKAGIKSGDFLISVDGETYDDMELMAADIRGKEGTSVKLAYIRGTEEKEVTMTRKKIEQHSVDFKMIDDDTGYISINSFIESTYDDFKTALDSVEKKNASNLILDLRDNGGGLVEQCIEVADEFMDKGTVVYVKDREGNRQDYEAEDGKVDLNMVVLVNENSASAAEILAAALKDNGVKLVGETTFGKGVIQMTGQNEDGSALKLTTMQYFSPKGNTIHENGVEPDYKVEDNKDTDVDEQLEKAQSLLQ